MHRKVQPQMSETQIVTEKVPPWVVRTVLRTFSVKILKHKKIKFSPFSIKFTVRILIDKCWVLLDDCWSTVYCTTRYYWLTTVCQCIWYRQTAKAMVGQKDGQSRCCCSNSHSKLVVQYTINLNIPRKY